MRLKFVKLFKRILVKKAIVLMYHRIADVSPDPWQLAVTPENFAEHLQVLQRNYNVISTSELLIQLQHKALQNHSICITFDDGYSDNFREAKPILEKYQCPATFFIATGYIGHKGLFWWDELAHIILGSGNLPSTLSLKIDEEVFQFNINEDTLDAGNLDKQGLWVWPNKPPTKRCELYLEIWKRLKPLTSEMIRSIITELHNWSSAHSAANQTDFPMTSVQLDEIARSPLFDAGFHTMTHPALSFHSNGVQELEIAGSREYFNDHGTQYVNIIAYPYGDYNDTTLSVVKKEKVAAAFTTEEKVITNSTNPHLLGRFQVKNCSGKEFETQLHKWSKQF